jgi:Flp pilus assembly protein TadG
MLPLFAILLLGTMEVGSIARDYQVLQNAAREGARFSANPVNKITPANQATMTQMIKDRVVAYLATENLTVPSSNVTVNQAYPVTVGALTPNGSQITVTYSRPLMLPGVSNFIPGLASLQLKGTAVFRNFY